nr:ribosomal protein L2 [Thismia javanica]
MEILFYKTSIAKTYNIALGNKVKLNLRNNLIFGQHHCGKGRNSSGIITARRKGGGHKRLYRKIDFRRNEFFLPGKIFTIEYDPNRNAYICLIHYVDGKKRYILYPRGATIKDTLVSGMKVPIEIGNALPLINLPLGSLIHNIKNELYNGSKFARSSGTAAKLISIFYDTFTLRLPSGKLFLIFKTCISTIGQVNDKKKRYIFRAGIKRWLGKKPIVRKIAMNPVEK